MGESSRCGPTCVSQLDGQLAVDCARRCVTQLTSPALGEGCMLIHDPHSDCSYGAQQVPVGTVISYCFRVDQFFLRKKNDEVRKSLLERFTEFMREMFLIIYSIRGLILSLQPRCQTSVHPTFFKILLLQFTFTHCSSKP